MMEEFVRPISFAALLAFAAMQSGPVLANEPTPIPANRQVDYAGFAALTQELQEYRSKRLITMDQFNAMAELREAIILDTRSAAAYQFGHIKGAINLPFSDFTEEKLAKVIGDSDRPILIYCNNNFRDNVFPVARKSAPLALNIPTFINLFGYGYQNIYELNDVVAMSDKRLDWVKLKLDKGI